MSSKNSNNKRPLPARITKTTNQNGEPLSEKKLRRLEKNRLSARECRRRKREATENLQRQINVLEGENLRLRLQLQVGHCIIVLIVSTGESEFSRFFFLPSPIFFSTLKNIPSTGTHQT